MWMDDNRRCVPRELRAPGLLGANARAAFAEFSEQYAVARTYPQRMLLIDRLVHAVHRSANLAARNLIEERPRQVLAVLDELSRK
jgi:hypothetical protein